MHTDKFHILMEIPRCFPAGFSMALRTLIAVAAIVRILVTGCTILRAHLRKIVLSFEFFFALIETLFRRRVTLRALHLLVLAL